MTHPSATREEQSVLDLPARGAGEQITEVKKGLPTESLGELRRRLDVSFKELTDVLHISQSTLSRRRNRGRPFTSEESQRILRVARAYRRAVDVLGSPDNARTWMKTQLPALQGETPLAYLETEPGAREVEDILGRIESGVYS